MTVEDGAAAWGRLVLGRPGPAGAPDATVALAAVSLHAGGVTLRDALAEWLAPGMLSLTSSTTPPWARCASTCHCPGGRTRPRPGVRGGRRSASTGAKVQLVDRLIDVAGCLPDDHAAPVLVLLAHVAWLQGNGALARIAIDRALTADPNYSWAVLIGHALDAAGLRPPA